MYVESDVLELKRELTQEIIKEVIALANTKGGHIIIGVSDDGTVTGVKNPQQVCESLSSMINDGIKPDITTMTSIKIETIEEKQVVTVEVLRGINRPYYIASKGLKPSGVYIRLGNTSIPADENAIRGMITQTDGISYENMLSFNQELHFETTSAYFSKHALAFEMANMKSLGLMNRDGLFTNLALLFSDECQHIIKVAVFDDASNSRFVDRKEFEGSLLNQLTDAYAYLKLNNKKRGTYKGLDRIDHLDYDDLVLREALINAIVHRDYSFSGSIIINIYTDRMEFVSIGGLVPGIHLEDIMLGVSQTRNEKLSNVFYRLELIESYGTGIKKITESYKESPYTPEFKATAGAFLLTLPNRNFVGSNSIIEEQVEDYEFIDKVQKINKLFEKDYLFTRKELQEELGVKQTSSILLLKKLEATGRIIKLGKGKNIKYKLR